MSHPSPPAETIFGKAIEFAEASDRAAYIAQACGADAALRREVELLVADFFRAGDFLQHPAVVVETCPLPPATEHIGSVIGCYKLRELLGEGGMGQVFVAEQDQPIRRKIALKIIKPGMDSRDVIGRFDAERQALALMDHPNIAKALDAGMTESGRPYFVMELVRGIPITEFCQQLKLPIHERLELFTDVCRGIQHAHQKGIIHRDIKPSNVLVTLHDDKAVPKVIDFGVAKATSQRLTEHSVYTAFAQMVGTPLYMSPEQAEMNALDVDTRSDVYSLGVLLYELITGTTPFDRERLKSVSFDEMRRIIREEEPETVSTRLAKATNGTASAKGGAANRGALRRFVSNRKSQILFPKFRELDWIVMKTMSKDRTQRYESASSLAHDIDNYLADEPVLACPPSFGYRFRKFARKNKTIFTTAILIAASLCLGLGLSVWQAIRATRAEKEAKINAANALKQKELAVAAANATFQAEFALRMKTEEQAKLLKVHQLMRTNAAELLPEDGALDSLSSEEFKAITNESTDSRPTEKSASVRDQVSAYLRIGQYLSIRDQFELADIALKAALEIDPGNWRAHANRGELFARQHQYSQAHAAFSSAIGRMKNMPDLYVCRGLASYRQNSFTEALADFQRADELNRLYTLKCLALGFSGGYKVNVVPDPRMAQGIKKLLSGMDGKNIGQADYHRDRASMWAHFGYLKEAQIEYEHMFAKGTSLREDRPLYCILAAAIGEREEYHIQCAELISSQKERSLMVPWCCVVAPDALENYEPAVLLARQLVTVRLVSYQFALGGILFRAGQFKEAGQVLQSTRDMQFNPLGEQLLQIHGSYLLAMTEYRLGHTAIARQLLSDANSVSSRLQTEPMLWHRRLAMTLLKNEATELILNKPSTDKKKKP